MEALGQLLVKIYSDYGLIITVVIVLLAVGLYDLLRCGGKYIKLVFSLLRGKPAVKLSNHVIFHKLDTLLKYRVTSMNIACPLRNKMFSDLLEARITAVRVTLADMARSEVNGLSAADFRQAMAERLQAIAFMWSSKAVKDGIPLVAIERFKKENDKWAHVLDAVILDQCLVTTIYQTNSERLDTIFDMVGSFEIHCFSDVERVVAQLNGEISACIYKGLTCSNCSPDCEFKAGKFKHNETENDR